MGTTKESSPKALVINKLKTPNAVDCKDKEILVVYPADAKVAILEYALFDVVSIDENCFSAIQKKNLSDGQKLLWPFGRDMFANKDALQNGSLSVGDITKG